MTHPTPARARPAEHPDLIAWRAKLAAEGLAEWIAEKDADAPSLTEDQCALIARLLSPSPTGAHP